MTDARIKQYFSLEGPTMDWFLRETTFELDEREELATAVRLALGTDSLADGDEVLPDPDSNDRRGWWADLDAKEIWDAWPVGCKNWLLTRAKITDAPSQEGSTLERARRYTINALQPFIDKRIASQVDVEAFRTELNRIEVHAIVYRGPEVEIDLRYQVLWEEDAVEENIVATPIPPATPTIKKHIPFKALSLSPLAPTIGRSAHQNLSIGSANLILSPTSPTAVGPWNISSPSRDIALSTIEPSFTILGANDIYTKILLHMDGSNGGTVFTDSNVGGASHTWEAKGTAITDTGTFKFSTASANFGAGVGWVDTLDHENFTLGSLDWTADCWFNRQGGNGTNRFIFGQIDTVANASNRSISLFLSTSNALVGEVSNGSSVIQVVGTTAFTATGFNHVALVRTGNVLKLFVNGVQEGGNIAFTGTIPNAHAKFAVGRGGEYPISSWNGFIDEFRLSVGVARWTSNFTPPTLAY